MGWLLGEKCPAVDLDGVVRDVIEPELVVVGAFRHGPCSSPLPPLQPSTLSRLSQAVPVPMDVFSTHSRHRGASPVPLQLRAILRWGAAPQRFRLPPPHRRPARAPPHRTAKVNFRRPVFGQTD